MDTRLPLKMRNLLRFHFVLSAFLSLLIFASGESGAEERVFVEKSPNLHTHRRLSMVERANADKMHDVVFAVRQKNLDKVNSILMDISDPESPNYGQFMTRAEVAALTMNLDGRDKLLEYLKGVGADVVSQTVYGEYVIARAPISVWEGLFGTTFSTYRLHDRHTDATVEVVRTEEYSLPRSLHEHVSFAMNTVQMPVTAFPSTRKRMVRKSEKKGAKAPSGVMNVEADGKSRSGLKPADRPPYGWDREQDEYHPPYIAASVTPATLRKVYSIPSNIGSPLVTQAVFQTDNQTYSPQDLFTFERMYSIKEHDVSRVIGGHKADLACTYDDGEICGEANLDVQ